MNHDDWARLERATFTLPDGSKGNLGQALAALAALAPLAPLEAEARLSAPGSWLCHNYGTGATWSHYDTPLGPERE